MSQAHCMQLRRESVLPISSFFPVFLRISGERCLPPPCDFAQLHATLANPIASVVNTPCLMLFGIVAPKLRHPAIRSFVRGSHERGMTFLYAVRTDCLRLRVTLVGTAWHTASR